MIASDPSERKHKGNPQSAAAHKKIQHSKEETYRKILGVMAARGPCTGKAIARALGYGDAYHKLSGRLSELKQLQRIRETGRQSEGCAVLVVNL